MLEVSDTNTYPRNNQTKQETTNCFRFFPIFPSALQFLPQIPPFSSNPTISLHYQRNQTKKQTNSIQYRNQFPPCSSSCCKKQSFSITNFPLVLLLVVKKQSFSITKEIKPKNKLKQNQFNSIQKPISPSSSSCCKETIFCPLTMDQLEEQLTAVMAAEGVDIWSVIDRAISMAARDHHDDLLHRRDSVVKSLYSFSPCRNCSGNGGSVVVNGTPNGIGSDLSRIEPVQRVVEASPEMRSETPKTEVDADASPEMEVEAEEEESPEIVRGEMIQEEEEEENVNVNVNVNEKDSEIRRILAIKDCLEDPDESDEETLLSVLQNLAAMDVTYASLKETDIGRQVNSLRKHSSSEVRRLVKQTVRKWKEIVDAWVKINSGGGGSSSPAILTDNDSPPQPIPSKNQHETTQSRTNYGGPASVNGSDLLDNTKSKPASKPANNKPGGSTNGFKNGSDSVERKVKPDPLARSSAPPASEREDMYNSAKLDSARKRLQENYKKENNAKKQRTVQVMGLHEIPKPKNGFIKKGGPTTKHR
ncbi:hypothetical protein LUZ60_007490 [Juncus effusus]|nr:hypothetical protein LUZ60_007490 [Juncus effusus]